MEIYSLQTLSFSSLAHDALVAVGVGTALLAGLAFISLGVLLPGLLSTLGGHHGDPRGEYLEFDPVAAPTISAPAPRRAAQPQTVPGPHRSARPLLWHHLSGSAIASLARPD